MTSRYQRSKLPTGRIATGLSAAAMALLFGYAVMAQEPQAPPGGNSPAQAAPRHEPGMLESIGRWFEDSAARFNSSLRAARGKIDDFGDKAGDAAKSAADAAKDAAKDAVDAAVKLPGARIIDGRERCGTAANGAPDCRAATETMCRGKGFGSGKSMEIQSAQKCPARIWLSGRKPNSDECEIESFVVKAVCQ